MAAARLDVDFIGIELDEDYLKEAVRRVKAELNERGLFESPRSRRRKKPAPGKSGRGRS